MHFPRTSRLLALLLCVLLGPRVAPGQAAESTEPGAPAPEVKILKKGGVSFYPDEKRIEVNGRFCLAEGPIELLACAVGGKEYESVISLDVNPEILHFCLVVMGLTPGQDGPQFQGDPDHVPQGSPVSVKVKWTDENGVEKVVPAEELCWNPAEKRTMEPTPWVFSGSRKVKDPDTGREIYWANVDKSIIVVFRDPFAVLDLPLASSANDESYVVNKEIVPKVGTPCTVILEPGPPLPAQPGKAQGGNAVLVGVSPDGRISFDGVSPAEPAEFVRGLIAKTPAATFRISLDQGAPPEKVAAALETLDAAGAKIESVETVHKQPDVADAAEVILQAGKVRLHDQEVTVEQLRSAVAELFEKRPIRGVIVRVQNDFNPKELAKVLHALSGLKGLVLSIVQEPAAPAQP